MRQKPRRGKMSTEAREQRMTTPGGKVHFTYFWERPVSDEVGDEDEYEEVQLEVSAVVSTYHPAVMHTRSGDPGWPEEGGEISSMEVLLPDGSPMNPIPGGLYDALCDLAREENCEMVRSRER